ncbi:hypothetical protein C8R44DRAFT_728371 [Mycena epipterygia]|nr:hypothetical protein C8R44DRAFT_728371 [Mycena epipterygia]
MPHDFLGVQFPTEERYVTDVVLQLELQVYYGDMSMVFVSAICLFIVVTVHWVTIVYHAFIAYVSIQHGIEAERWYKIIYWASLSSLVTPSFSLGLKIHQLWVVWSPNKLVLVVPVCTLLTLTVSTVVAANITSHSTDIFSNPWLKPNTVLMFIQRYSRILLLNYKLVSSTTITLDDPCASAALGTLRFFLRVQPSASWLSNSSTEMRSGSLAHWPTITAEWADFSDSWLRIFDIVPPEKEKSRSASTEVAIKWNQYQKLEVQMYYTWGRQGSVRSLLLRAVSSDIQLGHSPVEVQERSAMLQEHQAQKKLPGRSQ